MAKDTSEVAAADFTALEPGMILHRGYEETALSAAVTIAVALIAAGRLQTDGVPDFLKTTAAAALATMMPVEEPTPEPAEKLVKPTPSQIKKSITPDYLISFIDGQQYKTLKRHLRGHGYTPESYREAYGLPVDYPSVSANYSAQRSQLARTLGLGQRPAKEKAAAE